MDIPNLEIDKTLEILQGEPALLMNALDFLSLKDAVFGIAGLEVNQNVATYKGIKIVISGNVPRGTWYLCDIKQKFEIVKENKDDDNGSIRS